jgi:hypothetical protein
VGILTNFKYRIDTSMARKKLMIPNILTIEGLSNVLNKKLRKGGFTSESIKNDPKMEKVRGNTTEFGRCSTVKRLIREGIDPFFGNYKDPTLHARMMTLVTSIKNCDIQHEHGKRRVDSGLQTDLGQLLLKRFDFIPECKIFDYLLPNSSFEWNTEIMTLTNLEMHQQMFGAIATHLELKLGVLNIDFENKTSRLEVLSSYLFVPNMIKTTHILKPETPIKLEGINLLIAGVQRFEVMNSVLYEIYTKESVGVKILDLR